MGVVTSKHSPVRDLNTCKYAYTLPDFLKIKEYVDVMTAMETASHKDLEAEAKTKPKGR